MSPPRAQASLQAAAHAGVVGWLAKLAGSGAAPYVPFLPLVPTHPHPYPSITCVAMCGTRQPPPSSPPPHPHTPGSLAKPGGNAIGILGLFFSSFESALVHNVDIPGVPEAAYTLAAGEEGGEGLEGAGCAWVWVCSRGQQLAGRGGGALEG